MSVFYEKIINLFGIILKALPVLVLIIVCVFVATKLQSCGVFGPSKTQLTEAVKDKDTVIKTIDNINKELSTDIVSLVESNAVDVKTVEKIITTDKKVLATKTIREQKVVAKLKVIEDTYKNVTPSEENKINEGLQNSTVQIDAIWEAYNSATNQTGKVS